MKKQKREPQGSLQGATEFHIVNIYKNNKTLYL